MKNVASPRPSRPSDNFRLPAGTAVWLILVLTLLPANLYLIFFYPKESGRVARMDGHKLYRSQLTPADLWAVQSAESNAYTAIDRQVQKWASTIVLEKEARRLGRTTEQLILDEVTAKVQVTDAEVLERYARAPSADLRPYPGVLDEIRQALLDEKRDLARRAYVSNLLQKEHLRISAPKPAGYTPSPLPSRYPTFVQLPIVDNARRGLPGLPSRGSASAPVVLEVYSDFYCPFSRKFLDTIKRLEVRYPDQLRLVFRHFPLSIHPGADTLAEASMCAQAQGKFWDMHDALMAWQGAPDLARLSDTVQQIGADPTAFLSCMSEGRYKYMVSYEADEGRKRGVSSTPTFFLNGRKGVGAQPLERITPLVDWFIHPAGEYPGKVLDPGSESRRDLAAGAAPMPTEDKPVVFDANWLSLGPAEGPADAPVTWVEFIDYHCPFCQRGYDAVKPLLEPLKNKVRFYSKQFPLPMHPQAQSAAVAALCAGEQGRYWSYREELFEKSWGKKTPEELKSVASALGLDLNQFDQCMEAPATLEKVQKDIAIGSAAGVQGTPTFFVNGRRIVGANPNLLKKFIEEAVSSEKK